MKIIISRDRYIDDIKKEFNNAFPFLKIGFSLQDPKSAKNLRSFTPINQLKLSDFLKDAPEGVINISEDNSIKQIAKKFSENFGLTTHFFRKSGNLWLEIKTTEDWTLKHQNETGMEVY